MQIISPFAQIFGAAADNLARAAQMERQKKLMALSNQYALQRIGAQGKESRENIKANIEGQKGLQRQAQAFQAQIQNINNPLIPIDQRQQEAQQLGQNLGVQLAAPNPDINKTTALTPKVAKFFGLNDQINLTPEQTARYNWLYHNYWANQAARKNAQKFINIHGKNVNADKLYSYLSNARAQYENALNQGFIMQYDSNTGQPVRAQLPPEIGKDILGKLDSVLNKLSLGEKLTRQDVKFIESLRSAPQMSASYKVERQNAENNPIGVEPLMKQIFDWYRNNRK